LLPGFEAAFLNTKKRQNSNSTEYFQQNSLSELDLLSQMKFFFCPAVHYNFFLKNSNSTPGSRCFTNKFLKLTSDTAARKMPLKFTVEIRQAADLSHIETE
jgi:hypothetical protein